MDLGNVILRRSSINSLFRAVHPRHGLAWTDGNNVFLSPVAIQNDNLRQSNPIKLGEFDAIQSLCWSCDFSGGWCYLCVTQYQKVSIWRVEGSNPNLKLKLVRKISKNPLPQGCLWNPVRDILAIATSEQCNLYFRHSDKKSSLALPIQTQHGVLRSACWSDQGDKLYVATKSTIWIFGWSNIDSKIKEFTGKETVLTGCEGNILTMVAIGQDYVLLTRELPLDKLCLAQQDLSIDMDEALRSPTETLMNLTADQPLDSASSASLALVGTSGPEVKIISETSISGVIAPDLLSYSFEGSSQLVVVGSNTQCTLQFYTISGVGTFEKQHDIMLPDSERPKGLCKSSIAQSVYILVGKQKNLDSALLKVDKETEYELKLNLTKLYPSGILSDESTGLAAGHNLSSLTHVVVSSPSPITVIEELSPASANTGTLPKVNNVNSTHHGEGDIKLKRDMSNSQPQLSKSANQSQSMRSLNNHLAQGGVESPEKAKMGDRGDDYSSYPCIKIQNDVNEEGRSITGGNGIGSASWRNITKSEESFTHNQPDLDHEPSTNALALQRVDRPIGELDQAADDDSISHLVCALDRQESTISRLRRRIDELSNMLEECHMISVNQYQDLSNPEVASVHFTSSSGEGVLERKFLLDKGRLKLDILRAAFSSPYLILDLDGLPIVLTANIDGYIPLKFEAGKNYLVSCDSLPQGTKLNSTISAHQSDHSNSLEGDEWSERQLVNGREYDSNTKKLNYTDASKEKPLAINMKASEPHSSDSKADRLKAMILSDKSGNAMRRLQAVATSNTASGGHDQVPLSTTRSQNNCPVISADAAYNDEPVKPPRRGGGSKNSRTNQYDDGTDRSSSPFMDVTAAI